MLNKFKYTEIIVIIPVAIAGLFSLGSHQSVARIVSLIGKCCDVETRRICVLGSVRPHAQCIGVPTKFPTTVS